MLTTVQKMLKDESGATAIEYGLIAALIGAALIGALEMLEGNISGLFRSIGGTIGEHAGGES